MHLRYAGNLACGPACAFDESGCVGRCGDGVVDVPPEECDDGALDCNDGDCSGVLACNPFCNVGDCCYADFITIDLPEYAYWGVLSTSDENGGPQGAGYFFDDIEFQANAGTPVTIETTSADFDTYLYLLNSSCNVIASNDNGGVGNLSRIVTTLPTTDVYVIVITSALAGTTGDYDLSLY